MAKKSRRLVQWFGSNTENAMKVGELLQGCKFVGIPFAGGMSEVPFIQARQILCNDLHKHIINLCRIVQDNQLRAWLIKMADSQIYHPDTLALAQNFCRAYAIHEPCDPEAALHYFVSVWMGRGGAAGTDREFSGSLPIRWDGNGGGSNQRYRTAIDALNEWGVAFRRCEFICMDGMDFIKRFPDKEENGLYVDANWPSAGHLYSNKITDEQQRELAVILAGFQKSRVVVRYGEHPLIRELYPESQWSWIGNESRDQANQFKAEWLIVRNPGS